MGNVIKSGYAGLINREPVAVDLSDHLVEAQAVVDAAQRQGIEIIEDARSRAYQILDESKETGYQSGYEEGFRKGEDQGRQDAFDEAVKQFELEHQHVVDALCTAIKELEMAKRDIAVTAERDLLEFAVKLICKMTFAVGELHREAANQNLERALRLVATQTDITVEVNPKDLECVRIFANKLLELSDSQQSVSVIASADIACGGCRVHTNRTDIDATLEKQTAVLTDLLLGSNEQEGVDVSATTSAATLDQNSDKAEPSSAKQNPKGELET